MISQTGVPVAEPGVPELQRGEGNLLFWPIFSKTAWKWKIIELRGGVHLYHPFGSQTGVNPRDGGANSSWYQLWNPSCVRRQVQICDVNMNFTVRRGQFAVFWTAVFWFMKYNKLVKKTFSKGESYLTTRSINICVIQWTPPAPLLRNHLEIDHYF